MQDTITPGGAPNGEQQARQGISGAKEQLRQTGETVRGKARSAASDARVRAQEAGEWARQQWNGIQNRVESQPQTAALWALGIGVVAGILLGAALRGGGRGMMESARSFE